MEWVFNIQNGEHLIVILEAVGCNFDLQYKWKNIVHKSIKENDYMS
jgi:hypothetical protein